MDNQLLEAIKNVVAHCQPQPIPTEPVEVLDTLLEQFYQHHLHPYENENESALLDAALDFTHNLEYRHLVDGVNIFTSDERYTDLSRAFADYQNE